jgi:uncharacterized CHY-type Zn-finger protein
MNIEKFENEIETLSKFISIYCNDKHIEKKEYKLSIIYKKTEFNKSAILCSECHNILIYGFNRLKECPHEEKPRCRKCPNPCYEKYYWKKIAKIMRYSGMKLGLLKIKSLFKK